MLMFGFGRHRRKTPNILLGRSVFGLKLLVMRVVLRLDAIYYDRSLLYPLRQALHL